MTGPEALLPWAPLLVSFGGAWIAGLLPERWLPASKRRHLYLAVLFATASIALVARRFPMPSLRAPSTTLPAYLMAPHLAWDDAALLFSLLLTGIYLFVRITSLDRQDSRSETSALLALVGASLGVFASANLYSLCLMWALSDLALLYLRVTHIPDENGRRAVWNTWGGLVSTTLLVMAAVIVPVSEASDQWQALASARIPAALVMIASILRMGIPPLSGSVKQHWETYLVSLWTGALVWLRLTSEAPAFPSGFYVTSSGAAIMIAAGLLAALMPNLTSALPYTVLHGVSIIILAPIIAPEEGLAIALFMVLDLSFIMALICIDDHLAPFPPLRRWVRIPGGVALASLMGMPSTLGFLSHWAFLRACWLSNLHALLFWGSLSYLFVAVPAWRRFADISSQAGEQQPKTHGQLWIALCSALTLASSLVLMGIAPGVVSWIGKGFWPQTRALHLGLLFKGEPDMIGTLIYMVILGPLIGGLGVQRLTGQMPSRVERSLELLRALLAMDWLILFIEDSLSRLQSLVNRILGAIEGVFYLGWSLVWGLIVLLFLLNRGI